jgi:hypothetical protein
MAEMNELLEYLYESTPEVRMHGLEEIALFFLKGEAVIQRDSLEQVTRSIARVFGDHSTGDGESLLALATLSIIAKRSSALDLSIIQDVLSRFRAWFQSKMTKAHICTNNICLVCRTVHTGLIFIFQLPNFERLLPSASTICSAIMGSNHRAAKEICLRALCSLSTITDHHDSFLRSQTIPVLEAEVLNSEPECQSIAFKTLCNLSFNSLFLSKFKWDIHWKLLPDPRSIRILINGLQAGVEVFTDTRKENNALDIIKLITSSQEKTEILLLLRTILSRLSVDERDYLVDSFKLELLELLLCSLSRCEPDLARSLLLLPTSWLADKTSLVMERAKSSGALDDDDMVFVLAGLLRSHISDLEEQFSQISVWSDDRYLEKALRTDNKRQIEKSVLAMKISGKKVSYESIASITNIEQKKFLASVCENSQEVRNIIRGTRFRSWKNC